MSNLLFVGKCNSGNTLLFAKGVHCDEKELLKIDAFSVQSVMNLSYTNRGGILGILTLV